jgi:hypothetical protein
VLDSVPISALNQDLLQEVADLLDAGSLAGSAADSLIAHGVPWQQVAPYVRERDWWQRQSPRKSADAVAAISVRVWDATIALELPGAVVWVDPGLHAPDPLDLEHYLAPDIIVVTHAHADHTAKLDRYSAAFPWAQVIMSADTAALLSLRLEESPLLEQCLRQRTLRLEYGRKHLVAGLSVCLLPAGHLLGASQVELLQEGTSVLVTGEFALRDVGGVRGALWPERSYGLVLMEGKQVDQGYPPFADPRVTRMPILKAVEEAVLRGHERLIVPAQSKGQAQEIYAALVLAQQCGALPTLEIGFAGFASQVSAEYYRAYGGRRGAWWVEPSQMDLRCLPKNSLVIVPEGWGAEHAVPPDQSRDRIELLTGLPAYTHSGWSERMAWGLGVSCNVLALYHGLAGDLQRGLAAAGRPVATLPEEGAIWNPANKH